MRITPEHVADINAADLPSHHRDYEHTREQLAHRTVDTDRIVDELATFRVAAPSWALGTGGTRFGKFPGPGEPRTTEEKVDDVAAVKALTGCTGSISLHVPWDDPADPVALREHADAAGIAFDAMNSNTFQDNTATTGGGAITYKFGSLANTDATVRKLAIEHNVHCIELGRKLGSRALTVWLADGTNHPGQANFRGQFERVVDGLREIHNAMPTDWTVLTEHKPYEPAFYSSVNSDWGSSLLLAQAAGERARCLVDLGHHLPNANIEQVVSRLAMAGRLGGLHFNDSKYGDDDLTVGSIHPFQLFLIFVELLDAGGGHMPDLAYMIDESHNIKDPLEDLIQAAEALQIALAQALLLDTDALRAAQLDNDAALAHELLHQAFRTDVRPLVAEARRRSGAALRPIAAYRGLGYRAAVTETRGSTGSATGL